MASIDQQKSRFIWLRIDVSLVFELAKVSMKLVGNFFYKMFKTFNFTTRSGYFSPFHIVSTILALHNREVRDPNTFTIDTRKRYSAQTFTFEISCVCDSSPPQLQLAGFRQYNLIT